MANEDKRPPQQPQDDSRRRFLKYTGTAIGGVVVGGIVGGLIGANANKTKSGAPAPGASPAPPAAESDRDYNQALMFFNQNQFQITEAATERIFPADDLGPGAKELGVAFFIDHQLASAYGSNAKDYMMAPFYKAEAYQGYQMAFRRRELFVLGLEALDGFSTKNYQKKFVKLTPEEQDAVLAAFESDKADVQAVPAPTFFNMLRALTLEGVYSDPLYGGNKNMGGWKMRSFPGNQMSYTDVIEKDGLVKIEPLSLHDHLTS
ncbi:gluconate 2-dehydrogenase subunit 3 family protein [Cohnella sp. REN36]|uniref:gluconate 2-dehydrogenase subunit 3 family protein n=1 Tax=Cohnella sp. REN36 TaxID=2887347 RepID=UPI001D153EFF|nr:gluconate 2-dehydrogenase subunit 3 family protein [Cohnella sp. REN36]MCC3372993.1 gluconate 2-dehydrogenase subunit 3 family protein [Cohnella sp. REN36]